jgi:hypothetical protein
MPIVELPLTFACVRCGATSSDALLRGDGLVFACEDRDGCARRSRGAVVNARVVIAGGPRVGKTTLAASLAAEKGIELVQNTDQLVGVLEWSEASAEVATWFDKPGPWIVEGVATVRALRKWFAAHDEGTPCDLVIWLDQPREELSKGQAAMAKGCAKILAEIVGELVKRGVRLA